jgi:GAF domain-containing protein
MCVVDDLIVEREEKGLLRSTLEHVVNALALSGGVTFVLGDQEELIPAAEVRLPGEDKAVAMDLARDALEHHRPRIREVGRGGWLAAAPLTTQDKQLGVLTLLDERADSLAPDMELLEALGKQIGTGLENARMYAELRAASTRRW